MITLHLLKIIPMSQFMTPRGNLLPVVGEEAFFYLAAL